MKLLRPDDLPYINGSKVILRPISDADTDDIVRWRNDREVQKFFIYREPFTHEGHRNWLNTKVAAGQVIQYMILDRADGKAVGSVYFRDIDEKNESAEFGIFIGEASARGCGFGSETAQLFTDFGFVVLKMHRISLRLLGDNSVARRSYEKAGFITEGTFSHMVKLDGNYTDVVFMAKLAQDAK